MNRLKEQYQQGPSEEKLPDRMKGKKSVQAFYGSIKEKLGDIIEVSDEKLAELAIEVENIIESETKVDWHNNITIHNRIEQRVDDLIFDFGRNNGIEIPLQKVDEILENVKTIAMRRF